MSDLAVITIVHGRFEHLRNQQLGLSRSTDTDVDWVVVAIDDPSLSDWRPTGAVQPRLVSHPSQSRDLPLAAARNAGARAALAAGATTLVFLDVDCVPDPGLVEAYRHVAQQRDTARTLMCGPVSYLPPAPSTGYDLTSLEGLAAPHPARPAPERGVVLSGGDHDLFWSLSFAVRAETWRVIGGFCDRYVGYGGEDTDFGRKARTLGVEVSWIGSARAFHQHHATEDPPAGHLEDIVRNSNLFHRRWQVWPMQGWLDAFVSRGLIHRTPDGYALTCEYLPVCER